MSWLLVELCVHLNPAMDHSPGTHRPWNLSTQHVITSRDVKSLGVSCGEWLKGNKDKEIPIHMEDEDDEWDLVDPMQPDDPDDAVDEEEDPTDNDCPADDDEASAKSEVVEGCRSISNVLRSPILTRGRARRENIEPPQQGREKL